MGVSGRQISPNTKHRRNHVQNMSSIQVMIGQDLKAPKENISITGMRAYSPRQHSAIQKQKNLSSDIGFWNFDMDVLYSNNLSQQMWVSHRLSHILSEFKSYKLYKILNDER